MRDGSGYCEAHQADRKIGKFGDTRRGSRHQRGYGTSWDKTRVLVMNRDCGLCQPCLKQGLVTIAKQVDHVVPKCDGGTDAMGNLQAICDACHEAKTQLEAQRARGRVGG